MSRKELLGMNAEEEPMPPISAAQREHRRRVNESAAGGASQGQDSKPSSPATQDNTTLKK
jgi:hypothetical protein